jgi:hypothetical protein
VSGELGSLTFDELRAMVRAGGGDDLRATGAGWARAAELLERQADVLGAGLPELERAWDSPAGRAHADEVRALVARMRATADVARYNHAQMLAAADAGDAAIRGLDDVATSPAEREAVARDVVDSLNETYANAAARLTEPRVEVDHLPACAPGALSGLLPGPTGAPAVDRVTGSGPNLSSVSSGSQAPASFPDSGPDEVALGEDPLPTGVDTDLPDVLGSGAVPLRRSRRITGGGQLSRFPAPPQPAVAPVLPGTPPSGPPASPTATPSRLGSPPMAPEPIAPEPIAPKPIAPRPIAPRPARQAVEETYLDARGHEVRIRWRGAVPADPDRSHP